ncbi:MAG TPA: alkaline phosphatase family protein [Acidimicrobiia bacterium]|nr:alkaline phosphatase family protein [Acidimicrobiia bacterium]
MEQGRSDSGAGVPRRDFLRAAGAVAGGVALGGRSALGALAPRRLPRKRLPQGRLLDTQPSDCPIDTVVVLMMETRSFDHYLGWLGGDEHYLERGRSRYGKKFTVDAKTDLTYVDAVGTVHHTRHLVRGPAEPQPFRGCGHPIPGHDWYEGRTELADGFLADGTGNDTYALGYYLADDVPVHAHLARRFSVHDRSFSSLCAGTFPNRQYAYTAQSNGERLDPGLLRPGMFSTPTIFGRLREAGVPFTTYHTDIPLLALWGSQFDEFIRPLDDYFEACASGTLPNVVALAPGFRGDLRTDDHSQGDVRLGQRFIREMFNAFAASPQWEQGLFILTYDEWGGFFDHVKPPILADQRATRDLNDSFGLAGFRVPTVLASPYARPGFVDHRTYDHTSMLRFVEWRFLGAPPEGPGGAGTWNLTLRDRNAGNVAAALGATKPDPELGFDLDDIEIGPYSAACPPNEPTAAPAVPPGEHPDPFRVDPALEEKLGHEYPLARYQPWLDAPP